VTDQIADHDAVSVAFANRYLINPDALVPQLAEELGDPDVELVAAQARANVAIVEAIGTQIQVALETPGIKSFLEDAGRSLVQNAETQRLAIEHSHLQIMKDKELEDKQRDRLALAAQADKKLGILFIFGAACFGLALLWLVHKQYLSSDAAFALTTILSILFAWLRAEGKKK
jgi:hypothetical protein